MNFTILTWDISRFTVKSYVIKSKRYTLNFHGRIRRKVAIPSSISCWPVWAWALGDLREGLATPPNHHHHHLYDQCTLCVPQPLSQRKSVHLLYFKLKCTQLPTSVNRWWSVLSSKEQVLRFNLWLQWPVLSGQTFKQLTLNTIPVHVLGRKKLFFRMQRSNLPHYMVIFITL